MNSREFALVSRTVARLRAGIVAIATAMTAGLGLCFATLWLVIKGGSEVGPPLGLFRVYFPGYSVTWTGAFIGFIYGAIVGAMLGWFVAWTYNAIAGWRNGEH